jgi:hypothetical protein
MAKLTNLVETTRKRSKMSIKALSQAIGINPRTYYRKLSCHNGLTDLELCRAFTVLDIHLATVGVIEYHT